MEVKREHSCLREPLIGLRKPIKLSDVVDPEMTWENQYSKLNNYIKYVAGQVASGLPSAAMSAEDLYQEGLLLLYEQYNQYILKPENEFHAIFKASCWRLLRGFCYKKKEIQTVDLDEVYDQGYFDDALDDIYEEFRLKQVRDMLNDNPLALTILKELMCPSEVVCKEAEKEFNDKELKKKQGKRVFAATSVELKPDTIRRALGISSNEFNNALKELRSSVYSVYSMDTDIKSYKDNDVLTEEEVIDFQDSIRKLLKAM